MLAIDLKKDKKVYFASDFHLGYPNFKVSRAREDLIIKWLNSIEDDAEIICFLGDLFDFWYEYYSVVPKGFIRFQAKVADLVEKGIKVFFFTGNHDLWMKTYFQQELGVEVYFEPKTLIINGLKLFIGHGDGLGTGDIAYKLLKRYIFTNKALQFIFRCIHPTIGIYLANSWSNHGKKRKRIFDSDQDIIYLYCNELQKKQYHNYYIFGHTHQSSVMPVDSLSYYINLGTWLKKPYYAVFNGDRVSLCVFNNGFD